MTAKKKIAVTKRGPVHRALGLLVAERRSLIHAARHGSDSGGRDHLRGTPDQAVS